ncbi:hypothetical protein J2S22_000524 [Rhodoplanes tepidamans]|uniref:STN domain-containing protein n=1 Tax=Rhodoplanes sp. TEM TaxID=3025489 RepID=UPI002350BBBF|nr:STN domain-containing protein [Rhodoplanes sp. TEM]MDQ0353618.1 hypothetical protein [Rhodoplanes tepidamans]
MPWLSVGLVSVICSGTAAEPGERAAEQGRGLRPADETGAPAIAFEIADQPLGTALDRYGDISGREVLYAAALAEGRRSLGVHGVMSAEQALRRLLDGTGLTARFLPDGSFVLVPEAPQSPAAWSGSSPAERQYYGRLQDRLHKALCAAADTEPGWHRIAALLWVGPSGAVQRHERLSSLGSPALDRSVDRVLRTLDVGTGPPPGFAQPVLVMALPRAPGMTMVCDPPARAGGRAP